MRTSTGGIGSVGLVVPKGHHEGVPGGRVPSGRVLRGVTGEPARRFDPRGEPGRGHAARGDHFPILGTIMARAPKGYHPCIEVGRLRFHDAEALEALTPGPILGGQHFQHFPESRLRYLARDVAPINA